MRQTDTGSISDKPVVSGVAPALRHRNATPSPKFAFTVANLAKIACPTGQGRVYARDARVPGLTFCRYTSGEAAFYLYRRIGGRPVRIRIGGYPELTIEQSRKLAADLNLQAAAGNNPQEAKQKARGEATLGELFADFIERHAKPRKRESSWKEDEKIFARYLEPWKARKLSTITKDAVARLHQKIKEDHGLYAANHMLFLLRAMFNIRGAEMGFAGVSPCKGIKKFPTESRERFLQSDELPRFFKSLKDHDDPAMRNFFLLLLFTGARKGNVESMRWADINLDAGLWILPAAVTKNGKAQSIALTQPAVEILSKMYKSRDESEFVFSSRGATGHIVFPYKAWAAITERAGITGLRIHDLRRTLGSWQAAGGSSLPIIGKSLGHMNQSTTQIYARLDLGPVRQSVDAAVQAMLNAGAAKQLSATKGKVK